MAILSLILGGIIIIILLYLLFNRAPNYLIPSSRNWRVNTKKYTYSLIDNKNRITTTIYHFLPNKIITVGPKRFNDTLLTLYYCKHKPSINTLLFLDS